MVTVEDIRGLATNEKLQVMEMIWTELTSGSDDLASPEWHEAALKRTADRVASGIETPVDFAAAKDLLRSERK